MSKDKLNRTYNPKVSNFRVKWVKLFRPISEKNKLQPATIIVLIGFIISVILTVSNPSNTLAFIPFVATWFFILISFYYFRFFPLTWLEMTDEEKDVYRQLHLLPSDWSPNDK